MEKYRERLEQIEEKLKTENDLTNRIILLLERRDLENKMERGDF